MAWSRAHRSGATRWPQSSEPASPAKSTNPQDINLTPKGVTTTMAMTTKERELIAAVAACLQGKRDRLGRIQDYRPQQDTMRKLATEMNILDKLPNGGTDMPDQCAM